MSGISGSPSSLRWDQGQETDVERGAPLCWDLHLTYTFGIFPSLTTLVLSS